MYKVEILSDKLEQEAIARRKRLDQERKERIFNPKVDLKALDEQIHIKHELSQLEKKRNYTMDHQTKLNNEILDMMDQKVQMARRQQKKEINQFRELYQKPHQRRDFDLYDPDALQKDLPARISDLDPRIGVSSVQRFEGEDLGASTREKLQKEQMRIWTEEQIYEKNRLKQELKSEKEKYENFQLSINSKMQALQDAVEKAKRDQAKYDNQYNQALSNERKRREELQKQYESELSTREIINNVNGIFLTETPDVFNIGGGHKVRVDLFKGFNDSQKQEIRNTQEQQRQEQIELAKKKQKQEEEWAVHDMVNRRTIELLDREKQRQAKERAIQIRKENEAKATEDKKRKEFIDKVLYTNPPQEDYFNQFNTTSR